MGEGKDYSEAAEFEAADADAALDRSPHVRASDAERDNALRILGTHYADGRLDRAEFDQRVDAALAARTRDRLLALFTDLPGPKPVPSLVTGRSDAVGQAAAAAAADRSRGRYAVPATGQRRPPLALVPLLLAFAVLAALHGAPPFPLIPLAFILMRRHRRWNRWNREARPWI